VPRLLSATVALLMVVTACAPMRPSPGDLAPAQMRVTNENLAADLATIDAWERRRVSLLRNDGADLATRTVVLARAGEWLVFAREAYVAQPRAHEADEALAEARRLIESLSDVTYAASSQAVPSALVTLAGKSTIAPAIAPVIAPADELRANARTVHFGLASDVLHEPSAALLDGVAGAMRQHPEVSLVIEGHADPRGADTSNLWLSGRRAQGVRELLVGKGVDGNRVLVRMFGARRRDGTGTSAIDYARDRRVQLRFVLADGTELPAMQDASDLQIESQKLWSGALRPGLRRYVPEPGSTDVPPPEPVVPTKAPDKARTRTNTSPNSTQTTPRGTS
jgi:peptidoglycan-associated lipoprotein